LLLSPFPQIGIGGIVAKYLLSTGALAFWGSGKERL